MLRLRLSMTSTCHCDALKSTGRSVAIPLDYPVIASAARRSPCWSAGRLPQSLAHASSRKDESCVFCLSSWVPTKDLFPFFVRCFACGSAWQALVIAKHEANFPHIGRSPRCARDDESNDQAAFLLVGREIASVAGARKQSQRRILRLLLVILSANEGSSLFFCEMLRLRLSMTSTCHRKARSELPTYREIATLCSRWRIKWPSSLPVGRQGDCFSLWRTQAVAM